MDSVAHGCALRARLDIPGLPDGWRPWRRGWPPTQRAMAHPARATCLPAQSEAAREQVALADFLPAVGGALAGIPTVLFALGHSVTAGIVTAVVFVACQQLENHVPRGIVWHGPGQCAGENYSDGGQAVLELLNRFGVDGWELVGLQDYRDGGDGTSYWEATRLLTVCTLKRSIAG